MKKTTNKFQTSQKQGSSTASGLQKLISGSIVAGIGWLIYSGFGINHQENLPEAISAERRVFFSPTAGKMSYYQDVSAEGKPLVLIHSINAAASAYEMRPLFEHYRGTRPVYALDLPGYGFSERSMRVYSADLYQKAILSFLSQEIKQPADVIALSLSGEFAARAALAEPERFHTLALISPTGFNSVGEGKNSQKASESGANRILYPIFSFPLWARAFYDLIATHASIKYFLQKSFVGPVPESMIDYAYATSHQPGAENVPLYFISGKLFTPDIRSRFYENLQLPALVLYDHDGFTRFDTLPDLLAKNPIWKAERIIPTMGLPHWDQLAQTVNTLDKFWQATA